MVTDYLMKYSEVSINYRWDLVSSPQISQLNALSVLLISAGVK